jgi:ABC-type multidrug transport system fused ATPase/permease subunit
MECVRQIMNVGIGYFNKQKASDFYFIFDSCTDATAGAIVNIMASALPQIFIVLLLSLMLFSLSVKLTALSIFLVTLSSFFLSSITKRVSIAGQEVIDNTFKYVNVLFDTFNGMKIIRLFNREKDIKSRFEKAVDSCNISTTKVVKLQGLVAPLFEMIGIGIFCVILFVGSYLVGSSEAFWLGILATFVVILSRIISPVRALIQSRTLIVEKMPAVHVLEHFLNTDNKLYVKTGNKKYEKLSEGILFRNVTFGYDPKDAIVIKEADFFIPKGGSVGVVGRSGSGKSTIVELLLRFYDPQKGQILVDGIDLKEFDINSWRQSIGVVSQDTFLFHDSIKNNISFAKKGAGEAEIEMAAKRAHAHDFIMELPSGYDTFIGDRGVLLSGGQRQRLSIARAILAEPELLVFDEATSSLDTESERIVQDALNEIGRGKTSITIAHRLSTVTNSDVIIVFDEGRIVDCGKHQDLMQRCKLYRKLVEMQSFEEELADGVQ